MSQSGILIFFSLDAVNCDLFMRLSFCIYVQEELSLCPVLSLFFSVTCLLIFFFLHKGKTRSCRSQHDRHDRFFLYLQALQMET